MTMLQGGPADKKVLQLRRAARFLRIVIDRRTLGVDALDQPEDAPSVTEDLYCYEITGRPGHMHLLCRGKNRAAGGFYPIATYRFVEKQPKDVEMRSPQLWHNWCVAQPPRPDLDPPQT